MNSDESTSLIVDRLNDLPEVACGWVFVRESAEMYVEREGRWVVYVKPPTPTLWTLLDDDS